MKKILFIFLFLFSNSSFSYTSIGDALSACTQDQADVSAPFEAGGIVQSCTGGYSCTSQHMGFGQIIGGNTFTASGVDCANDYLGPNGIIDEFGSYVDPNAPEVRVCSDQGSALSEGVECAEDCLQDGTQYFDDVLGVGYCKRLCADSFPALELGVSCSEDCITNQTFIIDGITGSCNTNMDYTYTTEFDGDTATGTYSITKDYGDDNIMTEFFTNGIKSGEVYNGDQVFFDKIHGNSGSASSSSPGDVSIDNDALATSIKDSLTETMPDTTDTLDIDNNKNTMITDLDYFISDILDFQGHQDDYGLNDTIMGSKITEYIPVGSCGSATFPSIGNQPSITISCSDTQLVRDTLSYVIYFSLAVSLYFLITTPARS